jgi:hypothetical protein
LPEPFLKLTAATLERVMKFKDFVKAVREAGWSLSQLRCEGPPPPALEQFITVVGLDRYESYVLRLEQLLNPARA